MRAIRARYDPYEQARGRVNQLRDLGHSVDKVEIMYVGFFGGFFKKRVFFPDWITVSWEERSCPCRKTTAINSLLGFTMP